VLRRAVVPTLVVFVSTMVALGLYRYRGLASQFYPFGLVAAGFVLVYLYPKIAVIVSIPVFLVQQSLPLFGLVNQLPRLIVLVWALGLIQGRWHLSRFHVKAIILASMLVISYLWASAGHDYGVANTGFTTLLSGIGLACVAASLRPSPQIVLAAIAGTGVIASAFVVTGGFGNSDAILVDYGNYVRAVAFGLNSNYLGALIALGATATVGLALFRRQPVILLCLIPMVAVQPELKSRSTLGLLILGILLAVVFQVGFRRSVALVGALVVLALLFGSSVAPIYRSALGSRANVDLSDSDSIRAAAVPLAISTGGSHLLLGVGDGNFQTAAATSETIGTAVNTHNDYLRVFAEFGVVALVAFAVVLGAGVVGAARLDGTRTILPVLTVFLMSLLFSNHLGTLAISGGFWILLGTAASLPAGELPVLDHHDANVAEPVA
jgi:hypothetical protein